MIIIPPPKNATESEMDTHNKALDRAFAKVIIGATIIGLIITFIISLIV